jgi:hypothetical protein
MGAQLLVESQSVKRRLRTEAVESQLLNSVTRKHLLKAEKTLCVL